MNYKSLLQNIATAIMICTLPILAGCSTDSDTSLGTMEVRLHDAPGDYDEVNVYIERVEVNREEDPEGWITISEPEQAFNLIELANGAYEVLGEAQLEEGTYHQIRLVLGQTGHSVVIDSVEHDLFVPSGAQTGVKLEVNAEISEGIEYVLLLDFDAARSVVEAGQSPALDYLLQPVIKATNEAITGNIDGTISPAEAEPIVYALADGDTLSSTYADTTTGYFRLIGLEAGTYTVSIDPSNESYLQKDTTGVSVTLGQTNELGTIELSPAP